MKKNIVIIILFVIVILIVRFAPGLGNDYVKTSKLYINEIMASNSYTISDEDGDYSDYIEIYNGYKYEIDLSGYYLSDDEFDTDKWMFDDVTISPGEYLLVFASSKDKQDTECHTNFRLNSSKEVVVLTDNNGNIISKVSYENMNNDVSYGYSRGKYIYSGEPTPRAKNSNKEIKKNNNKYDIIINEYMSNNTRYNYDHDGYYYDWVELYNKKDETIVLNNLYLTDDPNVLNKYKLPTVEMKANGYLLIYLSGNASYVENDIYANFKLSDGEELILSNGTNIIDRIKIINLSENISYGKKDDKWYYYTSPTPGFENNTAYHTSVGG